MKPKIPYEYCQARQYLAAKQGIETTHAKDMYPKDKIRQAMLRQPNKR